MLVDLEAGGKLGSPSVAAADSGDAPERRLIVADRRSGIRFLVDTGANVSVLPASRLDRCRQPGAPLLAANGSTISTYGEKKVELDFGLRRSFPWTFTITDVTKAIVGNDFLEQFHLLPDVRTHKLVDGKTLLSINCRVCSSRVSTISRITRSDDFRAVLADFPTLQSSTWTPVNRVAHSVVHPIETTTVDGSCTATGPGET
uniref:uncharacterized protein LOC117611409 n=1 Tax=Osmia lignaria TaxID=473952 RepID=UPI001478A624|nr:uncharacterized protein LOC117611409 [Osmia lignaria]